MRYSTFTRLVGGLLLWWGAAAPLLAQYQPWAVQWLQHAYSPLAGRQYLGVTNLYAGTNVSFSPVGNGDYYLNVAAVPSSSTASGTVDLGPIGKVQIFTPLANRTNAILISLQTGDNRGSYLYVSSITPGVSFTVQCFDTSNTNRVSWTIHKP